VLTKVRWARLDAGIVYVTDITPDAVTKIEKSIFQDALNNGCHLPMLPISDSKKRRPGQAFVDLVLSPDGAGHYGPLWLLSPYPKNNAT